MKDERRTLSKAGSVTKIPYELKLISSKEAQYALSFCKEAPMHLQTLNPEYQHYNLPLDGIPGTNAFTSKYLSEEIPLKIDLPLLQLCFTLIIADYEQQLDYYGKITHTTTTIYYPNVASGIGKAAHVSAAEVNNFIDKLCEFHAIAGVTNKGIYPALIFEAYDREKNNISISSPYFLNIISKLNSASSFSHTAKKPLSPSYCRLVKKEILKEKNKYAVINVFIIAVLIAQAGNKEAHIRARTLINRNPQLKESLASKNNKLANQTLSRVFHKTWELLHSMTFLKDAYKNIQLPEANNAIYIPTLDSLDQVFVFPHEGKQKPHSKK